MLSFDVVSLFMNVPSEDTINIILKRIYEKKEIVTDIPKCQMRKLLYIHICRQNVHFTFNNKIYIQNDVVAMGLPLGSVLANVFMGELETALIPKLSSKLSSWRSFADDNTCFVMKDSIKFVFEHFLQKHKVYL